MPSVQQCLEEAVAKLNGNQSVSVKGASRTDKGTHALSQRGLVKTTMPLQLADLNAELPWNIRVEKVQPLPVYRMPRIISKVYTYYIEHGDRPTPSCVPYSWFLRQRWDLDRLKQALNYVVGTYDFFPFASGRRRCTTIRTIYRIDVFLRRNVRVSLAAGVQGEPVLVDEPGQNDGNLIVGIEICGDGFLQHMVRRIIGSVRPIVESNELPLDTLQRVLDGSRQAGPAVPARGLWLVAIQDGDRS